MPARQETDEPLFCGAAMLQYGIAPPRSSHADPSDPTHPEPLFVHANLLKHMSGARKGQVFTEMRRLSLPQDDVRLRYYRAQSAAEGDQQQQQQQSESVGIVVPGPLDDVVGGAREVRAKGLCSDIWAFGEGAEIETVDAKETFGGLMAGFEQAYFAYGAGTGAWR